MSAPTRLGIIRSHMEVNPTAAEGRPKMTSQSKTSGLKMDRKVHNTDDPIQKYIVEHSLRLHPAQQKLIEATRSQEWNIMLSSADEMQLLQNLIKAIKAKKTLDIGVYTGYSALSMALALPEDGVVVACDVSSEWPEVGKPFWREAGVDHKIDLRIGKAQVTLESLIADGQSGTFDFAFIDADKPSYDTYYELCLKLVRQGGIIAIDNVLWDGKVADPSQNDRFTMCFRALNDKIAADTRVDVSMLPIGDGTTLAFKK